MSAHAAPHRTHTRIASLPAHAHGALLSPRSIFCADGLTAMGIKPPATFKKAVTTVQLTQFASCITTAIAALFLDVTPVFYNAVQVIMRLPGPHTIPRRRRRPQDDTRLSSFSPFASCVCVWFAGDVSHWHAETLSAAAPRQEEEGGRRDPDRPADTRREGGHEVEGGLSLPAAAGSGGARSDRSIEGGFEMRWAGSREVDVDGYGVAALVRSTWSCRFTVLSEPLALSCGGRRARARVAPGSRACAVLSIYV